VAVDTKQRQKLQQYIEECNDVLGEGSTASASGAAEPLAEGLQAVPAQPLLMHPSARRPSNAFLFEGQLVRSCRQ
jgi:hypothetical protein